MDLLVNDLSIQEKFCSLSSFHEALEQLMKMRGVAKRFQRDVFCSRNFVNMDPIQDIQMCKAINDLQDKNKCRAVMSWLTRGPFWDTPEERKHSGDNLLECLNRNDKVVTDTAVGEAAFRMLEINGSSCGLISMAPSDWQFTPVEVIYRQDNGEEEDRSVDIENFFDPDALTSRLQNSEPSINSWNALQKTLSTRFPRLMFAENCFEPLTSKNIPFKSSLARSILRLLDILNRLALEVDKNGRRTAKGEEIHDQYFKHKNALFSDSSDTEKQHFKERLTFPHPERAGHTIFCSYHGKVPVLKKELTVRIHFFWPIQLGQPVYVVYIGPKLTKK